MLVGLALTPGGSTGSEASKQGYFWRCHRVGPLPRAEPPQIFTNSLKANTISSKGLNGITSEGEMMPMLVGLAFDSRGFDWIRR